MTLKNVQNELVNENYLYFNLNRFFSDSRSVFIPLFAGIYLVDICIVQVPFFKKLNKTGNFFCVSHLTRCDRIPVELALPNKHHQIGIIAYCHKLVTKLCRCVLRFDCFSSQNFNRKLCCSNCSLFHRCATNTTQ